MCGRFGFTIPKSRAVQFYNLDQAEDYSPGENIFPGTVIPVILHEGDDNSGRRILGPFRWGLVPHWSKDAKSSHRLINARGETVHEKPSFRDSFKRRRCLIPATCFYEWQSPSSGKGRKQPVAFSLASGEPFAMAGLHAAWRDPQSSETMRTCTIITCPSNELVQSVHDRMPVIVQQEDWQRWLAAIAASDELRELLTPFSADEMTMEAASI